MVEERKTVCEIRTQFSFQTDTDTLSKLLSKNTKFKIQTVAIYAVPSTSHCNGISLKMVVGPVNFEKRENKRQEKDFVRLLSHLRIGYSTELVLYLPVSSNTSGTPGTLQSYMTALICKGIKITGRYMGSPALLVPPVKCICKEMYLQDGGFGSILLVSKDQLQKAKNILERQPPTDQLCYTPDNIRKVITKKQDKDGCHCGSSN